MKFPDSCAFVYSGIIAGLLFGSTVASAQALPQFNPVNSHYYQAISAPGITWASADAQAKTMFYEGLQGHLATITSSDENDFVWGLQSVVSGEVWIGGFQEPCPVQSPACGWAWVNNEVFGFTNWNNGEPNDAGNGESKLGFLSNGKWNDEGNLGNIRGFVVEFDGEADAATCVFPQDCNPSGTQTVSLPPTVVLEEGDTLTQELVESPDFPGQVNFIDPRVDGNGNCILAADGSGAVPRRRQKLDVFGDGSLVLPPHLCGSPQFAVIRSEATFDILEDVVRSEQFPEEIFGTGDTFDCDANILDPYVDDLQRRGVFVWQADDRFDLIERHAIELTNGCGSSRGSHRRLSFFVLNLHINFGIPFGSNNAAVLQELEFLTIDKLYNLGQALDKARSSISRSDFRMLRRKYVRAFSDFLLGNYASAVNRLAGFQTSVDTVVFNTSSGFNHEGNLLMRAENIEFIIDVKLDP